MKKKHKIIIASSILFATGGIGAIATGFAMQLNPKIQTKDKEIITKKYVDKVEEIKITKPVEKIKYVNEPQKYSNQQYVDRNEIMEMLSVLNDNNLNTEFNRIKNNESELLKFKDKIKPLYLNQSVRNEINVYSLNSGLITPELNEVNTKLNAEPENSDYLNQKLNILKQLKPYDASYGVIKQNYEYSNTNHINQDFVSAYNNKPLINLNNINTVMLELNTYLSNPLPIEFKKDQWITFNNLYVSLIKKIKSNPYHNLLTMDLNNNYRDNSFDSWFNYDTYLMKELHTAINNVDSVDAKINVLYEYEKYNDNIKNFRKQPQVINFYQTLKNLVFLDGYNDKWNTFLKNSVNLWLGKPFKNNDVIINLERYKLDSNRDLEDKNNNPINFYLYSLAKNFNNTSDIAIVNAIYEVYHLSWNLLNEYNYQNRFVYSELLNYDQYLEENNFENYKYHSDLWNNGEYFWKVNKKLHPQYEPYITKLLESTKELEDLMTFRFNYAKTHHFDVNSNYANKIKSYDEVFLDKTEFFTYHNKLKELLKKVDTAFSEIKQNTNLLGYWKNLYQDYDTTMMYNGVSKKYNYLLSMFKEIFNDDSFLDYQLNINEDVLKNNENKETILNQLDWINKLNDVILIEDLKKLTDASKNIVNQNVLYYQIKKVLENHKQEIKDYFANIKQQFTTLNKDFDFETINTILLNIKEVLNHPSYELKYEPNNTLWYENNVIDSNFDYEPYKNKLHLNNLLNPILENTINEIKGVDNQIITSDYSFINDVNIDIKQKWVRVLESLINEMQTFITNNPNHNTVNQLENATTLMRLWVENKEKINQNLKPYFIYDTYHHTNRKLEDWLNKHQLNINQPQILFLGSSYLNLNSKSSFYNKEVSLYLNIINKLNDVNIKNDFNTTFNLNYETIQNNHEIYMKIINQSINSDNFKKVINTLFDFSNKDKSNPKLISIKNNEVIRNYELVYVNKIDNYDNILNFVVDANIFNDELIKNQTLQNLKLLKDFNNANKQEIIQKLNTINTFYLQKQKEKLLKLLESDWNEMIYQQSLELLMFDKFNYLTHCLDGEINTDEINDLINKISIIKQKNNSDLNNQIDMIFEYLMTHPYKTMQQFENFKVFVNENIS